MAKNARSARGVMVDFDLIEIQRALSEVPQPIAVDQRRQFINDKDGFKVKPSKIQGDIASALQQMALQAADVSANVEPELKND